MLIAAVVIETLPGAAARVAARLSRVDHLEIQGAAHGRQIAAVWAGPSAQALEQAAEALLSQDEEVLGVFPTFVGEDGEGAA